MIQDSLLQYLYLKHQPKAMKIGVGFLQALLLWIAFISALIAGFFWLDTIYPSHLAALIISGGLVATSFVIYLVSRYMIRKKKVEALRKKIDAQAELEELALEYSDDIIDIVQAYPKTSLLVGAVAGYILSDRL